MAVVTVAIAIVIAIPVYVYNIAGVVKNRARLGPQFIAASSFAVSLAILVIVIYKGFIFKEWTICFFTMLIAIFAALAVLVKAKIAIEFNLEADARGFFSTALNLLVIALAIAETITIEM